MGDDANVAEIDDISDANNKAMFVPERVMSLTGQTKAPTKGDANCYFLFLSIFVTSGRFRQPKGRPRGTANGFTESLYSADR